MPKNARAFRRTVRSGTPLAWCRRHLVFLVVLVLGVAVRVLAQWAFWPALAVGESGSHLSFVEKATPDPTQPLGYGLVELTPLSWLSGALAPVAAAQHVLGLAAGVVVYVLLLRWGVWRWLAALAAAPVLLDGYQLASEQLVLPDTLFVLLVCVAVLVLGWRARPGLAAAFLGAALLGAAATVRVAGVPLVVAAVVFIVLTGASWRHRVMGVLVAVVGFCLPVLGAEAWHHHVYDDYALAAGQTEAQRAATAPSRPADDLLRGFEALVHWSPADSAGYDDARDWRLSTYLSPTADKAAEPLYSRHGGQQLEPRQPAADALSSYQEHGHLPGPLLLGGLLLALLAGVGLGRAGASGARAVSLLAGIAPICVLVGAAVIGEPSWRDQFLVLALWPVAGALGVTALLRGRRSPASHRSQVDEIDRAALTAFRDRYGDPRLGPVVVVIAAYNEAVGLPRVLTAIPQQVCGLETDVVIVDDGSSDGTEAAAHAHGGGYLVSCAVNRGQGAAMRLGYRVARGHGAQYIITTDADAQYDTADFPTVLRPILDETADFVTGSRRLGRQHTRDRFRRAGVYVFAWTVSALTGERLTDTSFGLRAMRADVTAVVTLNQPQYQSSELLIGVHSHGYRIAEVPATMHVRAAGSTKKGRNLVYGARYARVVFGTWWREGCPAPASDRAPALRGLSDSARARGASAGRARQASGG